MSTVGFGTGMVAGGMAGMAVAAGNDIARVIEGHRIAAAFRRWDEALRGERQAKMRETMRATAAEATAKRLRAELARAQVELRLLRAAVAA